jgi:hypothetical protein
MAAFCKKRDYSYRGEMNWIKKLIILSFAGFLNAGLLTTCGIDEYYYLPQVPITNIQSEGNFSVTINIPSDLNDSSYYYASGYNIYYRIYTSNHPTDSISEGDHGLINSSLKSDYEYFRPIADQTTATLPSATTFSGRKYYILEFDSLTILPPGGGRLDILFPPSHPNIPNATFTPSGGSALTVIPLRSRNAMLDPDQMFSNTDKLRYTDPDTNLDIAPGEEGSTLTYVAMYIVAFGTNPSTFSTIFSKPTFVGVFLFP